MTEVVSVRHLLGLGNILEEAVMVAHAKIRIRLRRRFVVCRVLQ